MVWAKRRKYFISRSRQPPSALVKVAGSDVLLARGDLTTDFLNMVMI